MLITNYQLDKRFPLLVSTQTDFIKINLANAKNLTGLIECLHTYLHEVCKLFKFTISIKVIIFYDPSNQMIPLKCKAHHDHCQGFSLLGLGK